MTESRRLEPVPLVLGAAAAVGAVLVTIVNPNNTRVAPPCPFHSLTGWWCPLCGATRAVHALVSGDLATALSFNALFVTLLPALMVAWVIWLVPSLRLKPARQTKLTLLSGAVVVANAAVFLVARNTVWPALAP